MNNNPFQFTKPVIGKNFYGRDEIIKSILDVVDVEEWEDLPGKHVRVKAEHTKVHAIGNILEDKWFDPKELAKKFEKKKK